MCLFWWWKEKPVRTSELLETLERQISETEYKLGHSQERLRTVKLHICVIGCAAILSSVLWLLANLPYQVGTIYFMPLIISTVSFAVLYFVAQILFRIGIKRDERLLEEYRASVRQQIEDYKNTTDFKRANGILARYEAEASMSYDDLRKNRQKIVQDRHQRELKAAEAAEAALSLLANGGRYGKKSFWDLLMMILMGDDDEDGVQIALICRSCALHNGFVGLSNYSNYCFACKQCGAVNIVGRSLNRNDVNHDSAESSAGAVVEEDKSVDSGHVDEHHDDADEEDVEMTIRRRSTAPTANDDSVGSTSSSSSNHATIHDDGDKNASTHHDDGDGVDDE